MSMLTGIHGSQMITVIGHEGMDSKSGREVLIMAGCLEWENTGMGSGTANRCIRIDFF
jgi:hypothetical protein